MNKMETFRAASSVLLLSFTITGCAALAQVGMMFDPDQRAAQDLEKARTAAKASPGDLAQARLFAQKVKEAREDGLIGRVHLNEEALVNEAVGYLDAAAVKAPPDEKAEALFTKGTLLLAADRSEPATAALRESIDTRPSPGACIVLVAELDKQGDPKNEVIPYCRKALPSATTDQSRFELLDACLQHNRQKGAVEGLKWADSSQIAFYQAWKRKLEEEAEERRRQEEAAARQRNEQSAQQGFSVSLHNECTRTVKLFIGAGPTSGGTHTSIGANTHSSFSGHAGQMLWIEGDNGKLVSSVSPAGRGRYKILPSCQGFAPD